MMTYAAYLRKVRKLAAGLKQPYLCICNERVEGWLRHSAPEVTEHAARLQRAIDVERTCDDGYRAAFMTSRWDIDGIPFDNAKKARLSWLTKQIKLADVVRP